MAHDPKNNMNAFLQLKTKFMEKRAPLLYRSITEQQAKTTVDFPARGNCWASRAILSPGSSNDVAEVVLQVIRKLGVGSEESIVATIEDVRVQWSGYRASVSRDEPEPNISELDKYHRLAKDAKERSVILYFHGGFYCMGSPAGYRKLTAELARLTRGRCMVVDYRLAPQHPFPAAIIDGLVAFLSLLYPTQNDFHEPCRPEDIIFAGDSAGANIALSLLLLIRSVRSECGTGIQFRGSYVDLPFPAGFASIGCQLDLTCSFPFNKDNKKFDILLPTPPCLSDDMPACSVWPSSPPRADIYCHASQLCHPLVSPITAEIFSLLPPIFFAYGEEYLSHEGRMFCERASAENVKVEFHQYQHLLHVFPFLYPHLLQSKHCLAEMARFCKTCTEDAKSIQTRYIIYAADMQEVRPTETFQSSTEMSWVEHEKVFSRIRQAQMRRQVWIGPSKRSQL